MIIDAHAHACGPFLDGGNLVRTLDARGVDKVLLAPGELDSARTYALPDIAARFPRRDVVAWSNRLTRVVIGLIGSARHIPAGNDHVWAMAQAHPDRILACHWLLVSRFKNEAELDRLYEERRFAGLKLHQCWERFRVQSEPVARILAWAAGRRLPVFIHLYDRRGVAEMINHLREHPETIVIVGHLFGMEAYLEADLACEELLFEISTPDLVSKERLLQVIKRAGARQVVMGSDTPYGRENLRRQLERVRGLPIPEQDRALVLGGNMARILGHESTAIGS